MRRKKRQVTDLDLIKNFVKKTQVVRIALNGEEYPYVVPVNFGYEWAEEKLILFVHGANDGKKVSMLQENPKVAIEMDGNHKLIEGTMNAATYSYAYQSLIGFGKAELVDELEEKRRALHLLMAHAAEDAQFDEIPEGMLKRTGIIKITLASYTMKENLHPENK
ncbi:pyridoxamine 5'-phosphate oxidase family protein [Candidatus Enterococcus murrayae]|uniref:Pyridoxamine 5'-phosphate oxidase family protein n=1 Tax=Candidatus Enterococcus murrayae TaxID=2815321 RepID=A0ABS3HBL2_9ENTE|nr:pyridoxamine 5'-phosphate oxidase family protein [Enterococcus sp. MJM16]MBO0450841.1 pyridoxamine 5'-phosphate oxidase family protein [Enterococcus sp. MJM16]